MRRLLVLVVLFLASLLMLGSEGAGAGSVEAAQLVFQDPVEQGVIRSEAAVTIRLAAPDVPQRFHAPEAATTVVGITATLDGSPLAKECRGGRCQRLLMRGYPLRRPGSPFVLVLRPWTLSLPGASLLPSSDPMTALLPPGEEGHPIGSLGQGAHTLQVQVWGWEGGQVEASGWSGWPPGIPPQVIAEGVLQFSKSGPRPSVVYENIVPRRDITEGSGREPGLTSNRGALIQLAATPRIGSRAPANGVLKVSGRPLLVKSEREIAALLKSRIKRACTRYGILPPSTRSLCPTTGRVFIDELVPEFADWDTATVLERGRASAGQRLSRALAALDAPSPWGFSWASRVHIYVSPQVMVDLASRSGARSYRQVAPALARAGGVWLLMYRGSAGYGARAFDAEEWKEAPAGAARLVRSAGGSVDSLHFVITRGSRVTRHRDRFGRLCAAPMSCQWALADSSPLNRRILDNGVGAYRTSDQAAEWLAEFNRRFTD